MFNLDDADLTGRCSTVPGVPRRSPPRPVHAASTFLPSIRSTPLTTPGWANMGRARRCGATGTPQWLSPRGLRSAAGIPRAGPGGLRPRGPDPGTDLQRRQLCWGWLPRRVRPGPDVLRPGSGRGAEPGRDRHLGRVSSWGESAVRAAGCAARAHEPSGGCLVGFGRARVAAMPAVQLAAPLAQRIGSALLGSGDEAVERDRHVAGGVGHQHLPGSSCGLQVVGLGSGYRGWPARQAAARRAESRSRPPLIILL